MKPFLSCLVLAALVACGDVSVPALPDTGAEVSVEVADPGAETTVGGDMTQEALPDLDHDMGKDLPDQVADQPSDHGLDQGPPPACDDGNPCTLDKEGEDGKCLHEPLNSGPCDDNDPCTSDEVCFAGHCAGRPTDCDDKNPCTMDLCDKTNGCIHPADDKAQCDDNDPCTVGDFCVSGQCHAGSKLVCNDGNPCTDDLCKDGQCAFEPNTAPCSDGDPCTENDKCSGGLCVAGTEVNCDDGQPCTVDSCIPSQGCIHEIQPNCLACKTDPECEDGNPCTLDGCVDGKCQSKPSSGNPCDDKNPCTEGDVCDAGKCVAGQPKSCDDNNPCTDDNCNALDGTCGHSFNTAGCDDGNPCTLEDTCSNGTCGGKPVTCDDKNPCTNDYCDKATGKCIFEPNSDKCDDGMKCTADDMCNNGSCIGKPLSCDDGNPCTKDACTEKEGCIHETIPGCLSCSTDADCDDKNPCTKEQCVNKQCKFSSADGVSCEDGNACTGPDICQGGTCKPGGLKVCNDNNVCTADSCDPAKGCVFTPISGTCDDGDSCTGPDTCVNGVCTPGPLLCCSGKPDGTACSDKNDSTAPDFCLKGTCVGAIRVMFTQGSGVSTFLTDVDANNEEVWATGYTMSSLVAIPTSFIAALSYGKQPVIASGTAVAGVAFRAISRGLAVGDGGLVAAKYSWDPKSPWQVGGPKGMLVEALAADGVKPGDLRGAFSVAGMCPPFNTSCSHVDLYLIAGSQADAKAPFAKECILMQNTLGSLDIQCGPSEFKGFSGVPQVVAAAGAKGKCQYCYIGGGCTYAECMGEGVLAVVPPEGGATVATAVTESDKPLGPFVNQGTFNEAKVQDISRIGIGPSLGLYVAVGAKGLIATGTVNGGFSLLKAMEGQDYCAFSSVDARNNYTAIVGGCVQGVQTSLVLLFHSNAYSIEKDWHKVTLATYTTKTPGTLTGVSVSPTTFYVVGNEPSKTPAGQVFYIQIPSTIPVPPTR